jgi:hypothetical protein
MSTPAEVTEVLRGEGLSFSATEQSGFWIITFDVAGRPRDVLLQYPKDGEYLVTLCYLVGPFQGQSIESLTAETLSKMVRLAAEVPLAKLHYDAEVYSYFVISECALDGVNGRKLRRRLEACARLADRISAAFEA